MSKKISVDDQHFAFQIWDTAGQEKVYITVMLGNESLNSGHGSSIPPILTKQTITSQLNSLNTKKTVTYDIGNPGPGLGQAQKCGKGIQSLRSLIYHYICFRSFIRVSLCSNMYSI